MQLVENICTIITFNYRGYQITLYIISVIDAIKVLFL